MSEVCYLTHYLVNFPVLLRFLLKKFESVRRVFLLGDTNARVGSREIGRVVGKYGVDGVNENGQ